jgi:formylglycine-generating enzyme required for sulfatase activity
MKKRLLGAVVRCGLAVTLALFLGGCPDTNESKSSDAALKELTISEGTLNPAFDPETTEYAVTVVHAVEAVTVTGVPNSGAAAVSANSGVAQNLIVGKNPIVLRVTAENGATRDYTVAVTRLSAAASDVSLETLTVSAGTLVPAFDPEIRAYTVDVTAGVDSITVTGTPAVATSAVTGGESGVTRALEAGPNVITLTVTAQDGTTGDYTVTVNRDDNSERTVTIGTYANGSIIAVPASGVTGTEITLTITPDSGYRLDPRSLKYRNAATNVETPVALNTNTFTIPGANVTVLAEFMTVEAFSRLFIEVPGATVPVESARGKADYPFNEDKLPVTVGAFAIGAAEVSWELWNTVAEWAKARETDPYTFTPANIKKGSTGTGSTDEPVITTEWETAAVWCNAYSEYTATVLHIDGFKALYLNTSSQPIRTDVLANSGLSAWKDMPAPDSSQKGFRLPISAEWEFAARGGDPDAAVWLFLYPGTSSLTPGDWAWYNANSKTGDAAKTQPVGARLPNTLGLYDMCGNVYEWCWDLTSSKMARIKRGGSYNQSAKTLTGDIIINGSYPGETGFRVVRQDN